MAANHIQYTLLDANGELVKEANFGCPLIASTITDLVNMAADAYNLGVDDFLELMNDPDSGVLTIVREDAHVVLLTDEDEAVLQQLRGIFGQISL